MRHNFFVSSRVSRPAGLHHRPLAEPEVNLSAHPAPIKQTRQSNGLPVARIEVLLFPVASVMRLLDPTLRSSPITSLLRSYESVRPSAPHRYARLAVFAAWASPFASERLVPAVPRDSLHPLHAPSTSVAIRSFIRLSFRSDDDDRLLPLRPQPTEGNPEELVKRIQSQPSMTPLQHGQLLSQHEVVATSRLKTSRILTSSRQGSQGGVAQLLRTIDFT